MFGASVDVEVSRVRTAGRGELGRQVSLEGTVCEPHGRVAKLGLLDPNLVVGKLGVNEGCEFVCRPQLGQVHRSHVPPQVRNTRERVDGFLATEAGALRKGTSYERNKDQQRPHRRG